MDAPADPLHFLGLDADADERAVKRAYAQRLKTTRPEDDPAGFALLVAARDAALRLARQRAETADLAQGFTYRPIDVAALARLAAAFPGRPEANAEADAETPPAPPVATSRDTLRAAAAMAEALLAGPTPADADGWAAVFALGDSLPLALRGRFEQQIAEALNGALPRLTAPGGFDEAAAMALVRRVGEEFGWLTATRRVAGLFWPPDGRQPLPSLLERLLSRVPPPGRDENGLPIIDRFDLESFFGSSDHRTVRYYERARRRGRFGLSWTTLAFLSPPGWAALKGWYTASAAIITVGLLLRPWLPDIDETDAGAVLVMAALAVMAAGHVAAALLADRLAIARLVWHRRGADRASPYRDDVRRHFLAQKTQASRGSAVFAGILFFYTADITLLVTLIDAVLRLCRALLSGLP